LYKSRDMNLARDQVFRARASMPATAGRCKMPHNNRVNTSASLAMTGVWKNVIKYDPYAADGAAVRACVRLRVMPFVPLSCLVSSRGSRRRRRRRTTSSLRR
jgi:hypothetical protein